MAVTVLGAAALMGVGSLLARFFPVSTFQASLLVIATAATGLMGVFSVVVVMYLTAHSSYDLDDEIDWDEEWDADDLVEMPLDDESIPNVGRNEPCPCGSGKKFKYCCGKSISIVR